MIWDVGLHPITRIGSDQGLDGVDVYERCGRLHSRYTQASHTYRINLSPFTKDFRV